MGNHYIYHNEEVPYLQHTHKDHMSPKMDILYAHDILYSFVHL